MGNEKMKILGSCIQEIDEKTKSGGFIDNGRIVEKINYKLNQILNHQLNLQNLLIKDKNLTFF